MEQSKDVEQMLELLVAPAFIVCDGRVRTVNQAAQQRLIEPGSPVCDMLLAGKTEYAAFTDGCLYLTLSVGGCACGASVSRVDGMDIFVLEQDADQAELQAMALAAKELRKPLSNVTVVADRLFPIVRTDSTPMTQDQIARINRGLYQMQRVISNMSDAMRYTCDYRLQPETRDICAILDEIFAGSVDPIRSAGLTLRYTLPQEIILCQIDTELIERAAYNMLSNAVKYTPEGGVIDAKLTRRDNRLYLTVQDDGSGIDPRVRGSVFSRFRRAPGLEDSRFGIGLGMVLIRTAAAHHGGAVLIEQPECGGTRITMTIEMRQSSPGTLHSPRLKVDYAGERDHRLIELAEVLPAAQYDVPAADLDF